MAKQSNDLKNLFGNVMERAPEGEKAKTEKVVSKLDSLEKLDNLDSTVKIDNLVKVGYAFPASVIDRIKREAYWERMDDKEVILLALQEHFKGKDYEPIPPGRIKAKRGPKPR